MKRIRIFLLLVGCICFQNMTAQEESNGYWLFGLGFNAVDDTGLKLRQYADIDDNWHIVPFPSRLTAGYFLNNGLGFEFVGTVNHYKRGKIVNGEVNTEPMDYVGLDAKISYDLNKIIGNTGWFDPYVSTGAGYTWVGSNGRPTFNAGLGFNVWLSKKWGINFNSTGKFALKDDATNHAQHSVGVVFRLDKQKEEEAEEELPVVEEVAEVEEVQDTIAVAEEVAVVDHVPTQEELHQRMLDELNSIEKIYFDLNSARLTDSAKAILDKLVSFMQKYPDVAIEFGTHADSRGKSAYNLWLTEQRAKEVREYLTSKGIIVERVLGKGFGESEIINRCTNGVKCTEPEHRMNRRVEFSVQN